MINFRTKKEGPRFCIPSVPSVHFITVRRLFVIVASQQSELSLTGITKIKFKLSVEMLKKC
jgi:hypothetical protein